MKSIIENHAFFNSISDERRYLDYIKSMNDVIGIVSSRSREKENNKKIINGKLQLCENSRSDRNQYLQSACELSIAAYFCRLNDVEFSYEYPGIKNRKNVDISIVHNGTRYNIEVKCPNPKPQNDSGPNSKNLVLRTHGRIASIEKHIENFQLLANITGHTSVSSIGNSDHNIKEALLDSAKKFRFLASENDINCVIICGDDGDSLQHYWHALYGSEGLFTGESFHSNTNEYSNVNAVILTNIRHRHDNFISNNNISNPWEFELAFNIILENILAFDVRPKNLNNLANLVVHYGNMLDVFEVPGNEEKHVKESIKIQYFINNKMNSIDRSCFGNA